MGERNLQSFVGLFPGRERQKGGREHMDTDQVLLLLGWSRSRSKQTFHPSTH